MKIAPFGFVPQRSDEDQATYTARLGWIGNAFERWREANGPDRIRGLIVDNQPDWNDDANTLSWSGAALTIGPGGVAPWVHNALAPLYKAMLAPIKTTVAISTTGVWGPAGPQLPPNPVGHYPLWSLPTPVSVQLIDVDTPSTADLLAHIDDSISQTLGSVGASVDEIRNPDGSITLPLRASSVYSFLKRGAELAWEGGRWIVRLGKGVLGPVGVAGSIKDAYDFINWLRDLPSPPPMTPRAEFDFSNNRFRFVWPDQTVTSTPTHFKLS